MGVVVGAGVGVAAGVAVGCGRGVLVGVGLGVAVGWGVFVGRGPASTPGKCVSDELENGTSPLVSAPSAAAMSSTTAAMAPATVLKRRSWAASTSRCAAERRPPGQTGWAPANCLNRSPGRRVSGSGGRVGLGAACPGCAGDHGRVG